METPEPLYVIRGADDSISQIHFLHNLEGDYLASATEEGTILIWNLQTKRCKTQWKAHDSSVLWIKYAASMLWSQGKGDSVCMWNVNSDKPEIKSKFSLQDYNAFCQSDLLLSYQNLLCTPGPSLESVTLWNIETSCKITTLKPLEKYGAVMHCRFVEDNLKSYMLIVYENGSLVLWDWKNSIIISEISFQDTPISFEFDKNLNKGVIGTGDIKIYSYSINNLEIHKIDKSIEIINPGTSCICSRPDSKIFATGGWDNRIRIFKWSNLKPLAVLSYHKNSINCLEFSHYPMKSVSKNGFLLAAGSKDNSISLWNIYN